MFSDRVCKAGEYGSGDKLVVCHDDIVVKDGLNANEISISARFKWSQDTLSTRLSDGIGVAFKTPKLTTMYYTIDTSVGKFIAPSDLINQDECGVLRNDEGYGELLEAI